jgi:hypothetical protein
MKPLDDQLNRLLKSASAAPPRPAPGEAPFPLEARVLGEWRGLARGDSGEFLVVWFRRAAICGCTLALASLAWTYHESASPASGEMAIADSAMNMGVEQ